MERNNHFKQKKALKKIKSLNKNFLVVVVMLAFSLILIGDGIGSDLDPAGIGPRSQAMEGALVAMPDDLMSAFFHNPAGLSEIKDSNFTSGFFYLEWPLKYKNSDGYGKENSLQPLMPFIGVSTDVVKPFVLALGMYSTLGFGTEFGKDIEHGINYDIKNQTGILYISPTVSYQLLPNLSLGLEFNIGYGRSEMQLPLANIRLKTDTDGFGFGATLGLLYKPHEKLSLGLSWRSPLKTPLEGDAHLGNLKDNDVELDIYWPQMLTGGMAYQFTPKLRGGISLKWSDWSVLDRSKFKYKKFKFLNGHLVQDTQDGLRFQSGLEYFYRENFVLRCGYQYDNYSISREWISPLFFDARTQQVAFGLGFKIKSVWVEGGYTYTFVPDRKVSSSMVNFPGEYSSTIEIFGLSITYEYCLPTTKSDGSS